ncbi:hypothetical protein D7Y13_17025 [Corallococcus praedator]|uniref:Uncharacterized protein n=1 Tax=Corallococcus praedator TaxID=2316724 RepID=A0ABX9QI10_9BACT|nr:hypothetical protein D7Y13_17025 [Corallococcus praedator]
MGGLALKEEQRSELEACFRTTDDRRLCERCQAVLMTSRGRSQGTTTRNFQRFLARYRAGA